MPENIMIIEFKPSLVFYSSNMYFSLLMPDCKKHIIALLLLVITALPAFSPLIFTTAQLRIQNEMKEQLEKTNLTSITIAAAEMQWIHEGEEAIVQGKMFDVKNFTISGGFITLTGLFDNDEDQLLSEINELEQNNESNNSDTNNLFQYMNCFTGIICKQIAMPALCFTCSNTYSSWHENMFSNACPMIDTPPPKI